MTSPRLRYEPAVGDRRDEDQCHRAGARARRARPTAAPAASSRHEDGQPAAGGDEHQRDGDDPADAEPVHQGGGERGGEPEQQQVDRDRERDRAAGPAELLLQRVDQHARGGPEAGGADQRDEGHGGDPPGAVQARAGRRGRGHAEQPDRAEPAPTSGRTAIMCKNPAMLPRGPRTGWPCWPWTASSAFDLGTPAAGLRRRPGQLDGRRLYRGPGVHPGAVAGALGGRASRCSPSTAWRRWPGPTPWSWPGSNGDVG